MKITVSYLENNIGKAVTFENAVFGSLQKLKNNVTGKKNLEFDLSDGRRIRVLNFTAFVLAFNAREAKLVDEGKRYDSGLY